MMIKRFIVKLIFKLYPKRQKQQIHKDKECYGEQFAIPHYHTIFNGIEYIGGFGDYSKSWYVVVKGFIFIMTIYKYSVSYEIMRFENTIFTEATYE